MGRAEEMQLPTMAKEHQEVEAAVVRQSMLNAISVIFMSIGIVLYCHRGVFGAMMRPSEGRAELPWT